jgi:hypothetical protein
MLTYARVAAGLLLLLFASGLVSANTLPEARELFRPVRRLLLRSWPHSYLSERGFGRPFQLHSRMSSRWKLDHRECPWPTRRQQSRVDGCCRGNIHGPVKRRGERAHRRFRNNGPTWGWLHRVQRHDDRYARADNLRIGRTGRPRNGARTASHTTKLKETHHDIHEVCSFVRSRRFRSRRAVVGCPQNRARRRRHPGASDEHSGECGHHAKRP